MKPQITRTKPAFVSRSKETGTDYVIYVDAPMPHSPGSAMPSIWVMDGDYFFDVVAAASRTLAEAGRIAPCVVVGVGYGAGFGSLENFRGRDYTPTAAAEEPKSGGADHFLSYMTDSLWPDLARRFPLSADRRAIAGHSLGSLLALHALFQPKPFFNLVLASAPSIWWDNRSILGLARRLRDRQDTLEGRLYLAAGSEDTPSMIADLELLEEELKARPFGGLEVISERFAGRDHYNVVPSTVPAGLASLLG